MKFVYLLALPLLTATADTWQPFTLDQHVSVELPAAPTELDAVKYGLPAGMHIFTARTEANVYQLLGPTTLSQEIDFQNPAQRAGFYDGVVKGATEKKGNTLVRRTAFQVQGTEGVAITYRTAPQATGKALTVFTRCFVFDNRSYTLNCFSTNEDTVAGAEPRRRFFNSLIVKP